MEDWTDPIIELVMDHEGLASPPAPSVCPTGGLVSSENARIARCALLHDLAHGVTQHGHTEVMYAKQFEYLWFYGEPGDPHFVLARGRRRGDPGIDEGWRRFRRKFAPDNVERLVSIAVERMSYALVAYQLDSLAVAI